MPGTAWHNDIGVSPMTHGLSRDVATLGDGEYDVLVVGGGINGTGAARDAARRGLRVALVEKEDFGYGTTGRSTRLIHGGLRYLEMYDFGLVRESLRERERLLRNAPHLVRPLPFLFPLYEGAGWKTKYRAGMMLYDLLSYDKSVPGHRWLDAEETRRREPALAERLPSGERLRGAFEYHDAQVAYVERLCVENALDAAAHGARVANHVEVLEFVEEDGRIVGARCRDRVDGHTFTVRAKVTLNATGPWLANLDVPREREGKRVRLTKGVHLVVPRCTDEAVVLKAPDGRTFFAIPWMGRTLVGTTDTDFEGDLDEVSAEDADVQYLLDAMAATFPGAHIEDVDYTYAGVRSLMNVEGVSESDVSRKHEIIDHGKVDGKTGVFTLVGGKITPYRGVAEEVVDTLAAFLGRGDLKGDTRDAPLPGGAFEDADALRKDAVAAARDAGVDAESARHLADVYGSRYTDILDTARADPALAERLRPEHPEILAEVAFAVEREGAITLSDALLRRSTAGWRADQCLGTALDRAADVMAARLRWDAARIADEKAAYRAEVRKRNRFTVRPVPPAPGPAASRHHAATDVGHGAADA